MIYFVQEFDPVPGMTEQEIIEIYRRMAKGWENSWKGNKLVGLFLRKWALGPKPVFMALWQLPGAASLDEWEDPDIWDAVKGHMQDKEDEFWSSATNVRTRVMEQIDLL
jgi:hypothetical protein